MKVRIDRGQMENKLTNPTEGEVIRKYSRVDFLFSLGGLLFFLTDVVLDVWALVHFYCEGEYTYMGLLALFLVGSSVLGQLFSWFWYRYDNYETHTHSEGCVNKVILKGLHVFQLGVYLRYLGVLESAVCNFCSKKQLIENKTVALSHDLSLLRLFETFSESAPQFVLMLTVVLKAKEWRDPVTVLKALGSAAAIACSVTLYHRALRSFLSEKDQPSLWSSLLYFIWNLLLIFSRLAGLALFAYALSCYIFAHFLCWWAVLVFLVWCSKTTLMDSPGGEWLYRATVALIWYFSWFKVNDGQTLSRYVLYHALMLSDLGLLWGLAYWQTHNTPGRDTSLVIGAIILGAYPLGLLLKALYFKFFHPKMEDVEQTSGDVTDDVPVRSRGTRAVDTPDHYGGGYRYFSTSFSLQVGENLDDRGLAPEPEHYEDGDGMGRSASYQVEEILEKRRSDVNVEKVESRRLKRLAQNFFS